MLLRVVPAHKWSGVLVLLLAAAAWGQWTEPRLVDDNQDSVGVNTLYKEWCPYVTADGQTMYYASRRRDGNDDIYVCHRRDRSWGDGILLPFCQLGVDERNPTVNATNDTLYFIKWSASWDIFWCFRTGPEDTSWSTPERMPEPINSTGIEFSVWCTPDNQRLLFSSWRLAGTGEDIYECRRDPTTPTGWSDPLPLPGELNTGDMESYPSMGLDRTELFFWGRYDKIYVSHLTDSSWQRGDSLPAIINRGTSEKTPCITPDGRRLYFASHYGEPPPSGDIWYSERPSSVPRPADQPRGQGTRIEAYPNPFNSTTQIEFTLPTTQRVSLRLYDVLGREVAVLMNEIQTAGKHEMMFDASGLPSGVYLCRFEAGEMMQTRKMVLIK
jgi:hypothetical protein